MKYTFKWFQTNMNAKLYIWLVSKWIMDYDYCSNQEQLNIDLWFGLDKMWKCQTIEGNWCDKQFVERLNSATILVVIPADLIISMFKLNILYMMLFTFHFGFLNESFNGICKNNTTNWNKKSDCWTIQLNRCYVVWQS